MSRTPNQPASGDPARLAGVLLAAAGLLPFLAGAVAALGPGREWLGFVQIYAAIIASFICGTHWGAALFAQGRLALRLFLLSNAAALLGWLGALLPAGPGFLLLSAIFAGLLLVDRQLCRAGLWPGWFWRLRLAISAGVIAACIWIGVMA